MTTTFDVVSDFNHTGVQPAAGYPFTYGTETALNIGFTPFSYFINTSTSGVTGEHTNDGTVDDWYFRPNAQLAGPDVGVVATGGTLTFLPNSTPFVIPNDVLMMMPGSPDFNAPDLTVARFTAPSAGLFDLAGSFSDLQIASVGLEILVNGVTVFNSSFTGSSPYQAAIPFSINGMSLSQGATIDFVVDSLGQQFFDVVGLKALITENPLNPPPNPVMLNAVQTKNVATLSGTAEASSSLSVFDGTKLIGTVAVASDGTWSLQTNVKDNAIHSFTESSTDLAANSASSAGVTLYSAALNKALIGANGNDVLIGAPNDTLTGGFGTDTLVFNPNFGKETVKDYNVNQDPRQAP